MKFDWDIPKAENNRQKHGVTFNEAATVWGDMFHYCKPDPDHSYDEDRLITIGVSDHNRLLFVSHVYQEGRTVNRLISARKATTQERKDHEQRIIDFLRDREDE